MRGISGRQSLGDRARATSDGQMVAGARREVRVRILSMICESETLSDIRRTTGKWDCQTEQTHRCAVRTVPLRDAMMTCRYG